MNTHDPLQFFEFEFHHAPVVTLRLQGLRSLLSSLLNSDSLDVVLLPGTDADLGHLLTANRHIGAQLRATSDDRRLGAVVEVQTQRVDTDADAGGHLGQHAHLEVSRAEEALRVTVRDLLDFGVLEVLARLGALHWNFTALCFRSLQGGGQLEAEVSRFGDSHLLGLLQLGGSGLGYLAKLAGLEASNLRVKSNNGLEHRLGVLLINVTSLLQNSKRALHMVVKILKNIVDR